MHTSSLRASILVGGSLVLVTLLSSPARLNGQATDVTISNPSPPAKESEPLGLEVALLRASLATEREHNAAILSTVYWSLSMTGAIAILLLGFGWFVNFRVYERDKEALGKSLASELATTMFQATEGLKAAQLQSDARQTDWQGKTEEALRQRAESAADERFDRLLRASESLALHHDELRLDHKLLKAESLIASGSIGRAFTTYVEAANLAGRLGLPHMVNQILTTLDKQVRSMSSVFPSDIQKLTVFLNGLENGDPTLVDRLADALRAAKPHGDRTI